MALATRELELVIIARDRASTVLARIGGAMAILGAGVARAGAAGIGELAEMTNEAIEFRRQVALAFTQAEIAGVEYNDVLNLIKNTARNSAVPIEELAATTFDIFSSVTLDNMDQAQMFLQMFADAATAGQAPIQDVGRAAMAWINAMDWEPTAENMQRILDNQFELVRKGVGTYEEFESVIGRAIPAFVSADQTIEHLGGVMAFLTRNGLHTANASASAARAIELLYSPKAIKGLGKLGIKVTDVDGTFRDMEDVIGELVPMWNDMDAATRKMTFKDLFGQGTIQARRFFDLVLEEDNFEEFLFLLGEMQTSAGAMGEAFDIMTQEPAVQLEFLRNRFRVLRLEVGDRFIPLLTKRLIPAIDQLLGWWEDLSEEQKDNLTWWVGFAAVFVTVGGAIASMAGSFLLILGLLKAFAGSIGLAVLLGGGIALAISAIAAAIALAVLDWETFVEIFGPWWEKILDVMEPVADWLKTNWPEAWAIAEEAYQNVLLWFDTEWPPIWHRFQSEVRNFMENEWPTIWANAETALLLLEQWFETLWDTKLRDPVEGFITWVQERWNLIWDDLQAIGQSFLDIDWKPLWDTIKEVAGTSGVEVGKTLLSFAELVVAIFGMIAAVVMFIWTNFGQFIVEGIRIVVQAVGRLIESLLKMAQGTMSIITGILTLDPGKVAEGWGLAAEGGALLVNSAFETVGDAAANNMAAMETALDLASGDMAAFVTDMEEQLDKLKRIVEEDVPYINGIMQTMSPYTHQSPSLIEQVQSGFTIIAQTMRDRLAQIRNIAGTAMPAFQSGMTGLVPPLALAGVGVPPVVPAPLGTALPPPTQPQTVIERQVVFEEGAIQVESQADPSEIARAIAWEVLNT